MARGGKRERPHFGAGKLEPRQRVGFGWLARSLLRLGRSCACVCSAYHMWQIVCVVYARTHVATWPLGFSYVQVSTFFFFSFDVGRPGLAWAQPSRHHPRVPFLSVWWRFYISIIFSVRQISWGLSLHVRISHG